MWHNTVFMNKNWLLELADALHISLPAFLAGGAGGFLMMIRQTKMTAWKAFTVIVSGAIAAGYASWPILQTANYSPQFIAFIGFLIGLFGMLVTDIVVSVLQVVAADPKMVFDLIPFLKNRKKSYEYDENDVADAADGSDSHDGDGASW
jgi:hypothetical protein